MVDCGVDHRWPSAPGSTQYHILEGTYKFIQRTRANKFFFISCVFCISHRTYYIIILRMNEHLAIETVCVINKGVIEW